MKQRRRPPVRIGLKWLVAAAAAAPILLLACNVIYYGLTYARGGWYIGLCAGDFVCGVDPSCPQGLVNSSAEPYYWGPARGSPHLAIPLWPFELSFFPLALGAARLFWKDMRYQIPGLCRTCGYDLAGLSGARCPECGASHA